MLTFTIPTNVHCTHTHTHTAEKLLAFVHRIKIYVIYCDLLRCCQENETTEEREMKLCDEREKESLMFSLHCN